MIKSKNKDMPHKNNKKHLTFVFDLDNTLVKTNLANNNSYKDAISLVTNIDIEINSRRRFTRKDLKKCLYYLPNNQFSKIIDIKEKIFINHISCTALNYNLYTILRALNISGNETLLLTNCHRIRALQLCSHYNLSHYFSNQFFFEDYSENKYHFLTQKGYDLDSIILFENDRHSAHCAIENGINKSNIIKVKF